jgi:hypothetical protein
LAEHVEELAQKNEVTEHKTRISGYDGQIAKIQADTLVNTRKIRWYPDRAQKLLIAQYFGIHRFIYNRCVEHCFHENQFYNRNQGWLEFQRAHDRNEWDLSGSSVNNSNMVKYLRKKFASVDSFEPNHWINNCGLVTTDIRPSKSY